MTYKVVNQCQDAKCGFEHVVHWFVRWDGSERTEAKIRRPSEDVHAVRDHGTKKRF